MDPHMALCLSETAHLKRSKTKAYAPIIDDRVYSVVTINGYRMCNLTRAQAMRHADTLEAQMKRNGWRGKVHVYYRDGTLVDRTRT